MKKVIALVVLLSIMLGSVTVSYAATEGKYGLFSYRLNGNGTAVITNYDWNGWNGKDDIYVPPMIEGYPVTAIDDEAFLSTQVIPYNDTTPGARVHLPESLVSIGNKAFFGSSLETVNIPNSIMLIGEGAFSNCKKLIKMDVAAGHTKYTTIEGVLYDKTKKELVACPHKVIMGKYGELQIPEGIVRIGSYAFYRMAKEGYISKVIIPSTVKEIGESAFWGAGISYNFLTEELATVGDYAFHGARISVYTNDVGGVFPVLHDVGKGCFENAILGWNDTYFVFEDEIPDYTFSACTTDSYARKEVFVSGDFKKIGKYAFAAGYLEPVLNLTWDACTEIDEHAFENARISYKGDYFEFGSALRKIGASAFAGCSVNEYKLPDTVEYIAYDAFDLHDDTFSVSKGSYAEIWATQNGYGYKCDGEEDDLSWLMS